MEVCSDSDQLYASSGFLTGWISALSPALVIQMLARRNIIRHVDGIPDPSPGGVSSRSTGTLLGGCGAVIAEENVVDLDASNPLAFSWCGSSEFFANQTSAGSLIQGYNSASSTAAPELSTNVEDAAVLAF